MAEPQFVVQRLYIKDASFEIPKAPQVFQQKWEPQLKLDLNAHHNEIETGSVYEVCLVVTATVTNQNEVAFIAEVTQGGVFTIQGVPLDQLEQLLGSFCPNILYPYAREKISSLVLGGSFPQLVLAPINFEAWYQQQKEAKQRDGVAAANGTISPNATAVEETEQ